MGQDGSKTDPRGHLGVPRWVKRGPKGIPKGSKRAPIEDPEGFQDHCLLIRAQLLRGVLGTKPKLLTSLLPRVAADLQHYRGTPSRGDFKVNEYKFGPRLDKIMPYQEVACSGNTRFDGVVTIEDVDIYDNPMTEKGFTVKKGGE